MSVIKAKSVEVATADCRVFERCLRNWLSGKKFKIEFQKIDVDLVFNFICDNRRKLHEIIVDHFDHRYGLPWFESKITELVGGVNVVAGCDIDISSTVNIIVLHPEDLEEIFLGRYTFGITE